MQMMLSILLALVVVGLLTMAAYWYLRARELSDQMARRTQKQLDSEVAATAAPKNEKPPESPIEQTEFEKMRLSVRHDARQQADALSNWESEGGRVVDDDSVDGVPPPLPGVVKRRPQSIASQEDSETDRLWLDLGGEG